MARAAAPIFSGLRARTRTTRRRSNSMGTGTRTILRQMTRAVTSNPTSNPTIDPGPNLQFSGTTWKATDLGSRGALNRGAQYRAMTLALVFAVATHCKLCVLRQRGQQRQSVLRRGLF